MAVMDMFRLDSRVALITGGGSGIGKGCALALAEAGANVVITGRREDQLRHVREEIKTAGGLCECFACDVGKEENCRAMVEFCVEKFGRLDVIVNNAGVRGENGSLEREFSAGNLEATMSVDFNGVFYGVKYAWPYLERNGCGSIINISSLAALRGSGPIVYSAAKGAVRSMSKSLARKLGGKRIRVNTVYPGLILTEMNRGILDDPGMEKHFRDESPMGLLGEPEDIAACVVYLASDAARFVTGQDFVIDGGAMA